VHAGEDPGLRGQPTAEVEVLAPLPPTGAGRPKVRELAKEPDDGEALELAHAVLAMGAGLEGGEREALRTALPPDTALVGDRERAAGLDVACPGRLLLVGRGPAPAPVRLALSPETRVAVAGPRPAQKDLPGVALVWRPTAGEGMAALADALAGVRAGKEGPA
jgi:hypothetical protein